MPTTTTHLLDIETLYLHILNLLKYRSVNFITRYIMIITNDWTNKKRYTKDETSRDIDAIINKIIRCVREIWRNFFYLYGRNFESPNVCVCLVWGQCRCDFVESFSRYLIKSSNKQSLSIRIYIRALLTRFINFSC